jgi:hypothetical protein
MRKTVAVALLVTIATPFGALAMPAQGSLSGSQGFSTMKLVATAEVAFAAGIGNGSYGDLAAIVGEFGSTAQLVKITDPSSGVIFDYTLQVTVSADRKHYLGYTGHPIC